MLVYPLANKHWKAIGHDGEQFYAFTTERFGTTTTTHLLLSSIKYPLSAPLNNLYSRPQDGQRRFTVYKIHGEQLVMRRYVLPPKIDPMELTGDMNISSIPHYGADSDPALPGFEQILIINLPGPENDHYDWTFACANGDCSWNALGLLGEPNTGYAIVLGRIHTNVARRPILLYDDYYLDFEGRRRSKLNNNKPLDLYSWPSLRTGLGPPMIYDVVPGRSAYCRNYHVYTVMEPGTIEQLSETKLVLCSPKPTRKVVDLALSPNGEFLTVVTHTTIDVHDAQSGQRLYSLSPPGAPFKKACWSPDGLTFGVLMNKSILVVDAQ